MMPSCFIMENRTDCSHYYETLANDLNGDKNPNCCKRIESLKRYENAFYKSKSGMLLSKICGFALKKPTISFFICCLCCLAALLIIQVVCYSAGGLASLNKFTGRTQCCNFNALRNQSYERLILSRTENLTRHSMCLSKQCENISENGRFDCFSHEATSESDCYSRGCCWAQERKNDFIPQCFYPAQFRSYELKNISIFDKGTVAYFQMTKNSSLPKNIPIIKIEFNYWTQDILQIKIYDPVNARFEPPFPKLPSMGPQAAKNTKYSVKVNEFGFHVLRNSNNRTIFNADDTGGLIFSDQLLQLSAGLPSHHLFGLGQQRNNFLLDTNWTRITLFNHDLPPKNGNNLYGSHPFYLAMEEGGSSNGVLLLNSNAMDIILQPLPAITYRTIGGIFNFFFFLGPTPADVLQQYTQLVGRPSIPPYWSLGFHLCRFGYKTLLETKKVWNRTRASGIPFDTQWNDLDYMQAGNDFTYDKERFHGLPEFVNNLHQAGMHYMVLVDPGVSAGELPGVYPPYDQGVAQQVFVTDSSGNQPFIGKVWNKESTVWVDFLKPESVSYWIDQLRRMHNMFAFDGAWIDMNDPSNFLNGTVNGCPNSTLDDPPYLPSVDGRMLHYRTLCMSARHARGMTHYDVHNIYGLAEALVTNFAMQQIRNKRAFVISRSSFPGHGRYAGVWTGDISSTWDDMAHSISDILSFSLFGIPMSGADICGFSGNASVELCTRWSQLGAFYPFSRNHNSDQSSDQDPVAMGPQVVEAARSALLVRYSLLPYLYTLFWHAHSQGATVARPMFVEFPNDSETYSIHSQFLWGSSLLISPVLKEGATEVEVYLPLSQWYNFFSGQQIHGNSSWQVFPAKIDTIQLFIRGGHVLPSQHPELTTTHSRSNPIDLVVALDGSGKASGDLYWDDGDSLGHNDGIFNLIGFEVANQKLHTEIKQWKYSSEKSVLGKVKVFGVGLNVKEVNCNGKNVSFEYNSIYEVLKVNTLMMDMSKVIELQWK